ncbi:hypothetical protein [Albibacterium sp.]|uniref:hypothetical protein n=1 Tax=Albibacterium sp. TaxID=2952885 RepID=UPI002CFBA5F3|nr:hypothetical protein [Albibacterium sp.]HUH19557.1 hypothetical protein [Albibacterium sp.]
MEEFVDSVLSIKWWITALIGALVLDILKDFIKQKISKYYKHAYTSYAKSVEIRKNKDNELIALLKNDYQKFVVYTLKTIYHYVTLFFFLNFCILMSILYITSFNADLEGLNLMKSNYKILSLDETTIKFIAYFAIVILLFFGMILMSFIIKDNKRKIIYIVAIHYLKKG